MKKLSQEQQKRLDELNERFIQAAEQGKVRQYPKQIFDALRSYHYGGMPLSILLFIPELCNGQCYDMSTVMTLAFDECKQLYGDIESLRILTEGGESPMKADHAFVEAYGYIFDTSNGLMYEKDTYWDIEKPTIRASHTKAECLEFLEADGTLGNDFERDKWSLLFILPIAESIVNNPRQIATKFNQKLLLEEIAKLKAEINFEGMKAEQDADIELMRTDPHALDKKFGSKADMQDSKKRAKFHADIVTQHMREGKATIKSATDLSCL